MAIDFNTKLDDFFGDETKTIGPKKTLVPDDVNQDLDSFETPEGFVPGDESEVIDSEALETEELEQEDPEGEDVFSSITFEESAQLAALAVSGVTVTIGKGLYTRKKHKIFTKDELVQLAKIKSKKPEDLDETETVLYARFMNMQEAVERLPFDEDEKDEMAKMLAYYMKKYNKKMSAGMMHMIQFVKLYGARYSDYSKVN
jgi:hypothetical protein